MVRGARAAQPDLSPDESATPFFGPHLRAPPRQVYQARPYVSPDTQEWVISNSTLMPTPDGSKRAIVHFEVTIESFRRVAAGLSSQFDVAVVEAGSGRVVIDSRRPQAVGAPLGAPEDHRLRRLVAAGSPQGSSSVGDHPVAYQRLQPQPGNANDWYVVAVARAPTGPLYGVSGWSIALMLFDLNGFKAYNDTFGHPPATRCWSGWPPRSSRPWPAKAGAPTGSAGTSSASSPRSQTTR
jgi:hypothetical protein